MQGHRHHWHTIMSQGKFTYTSFCSTAQPPFLRLIPPLSLPITKTTTQDWVLRRLNTIMPDPAKLNNNNKTKGYYSLQCIEYADGQRVGGPAARNVIRPRDIGKYLLYIHLLSLNCSTTFSTDQSHLSLFPNNIGSNIGSNGPYWVQTLAGRFDLWWEEFGKQWFFYEDERERQVPELIVAPCCSSFIITKEAIKRWPLEFYVELRKYVMLSAMDGKWMATVLEHAWPLIFANSTDYYQPQDVCMCDLYHMCTS